MGESILTVDIDICRWDILFVSLAVQVDPQGAELPATICHVPIAPIAPQVIWGLSISASR